MFERFLGLFGATRVSVDPSQPARVDGNVQVSASETSLQPGRTKVAGREASERANQAAPAQAQVSSRSATMGTEARPAVATADVGTGEEPGFFGQICGRISNAIYSKICANVSDTFKEGWKVLPLVSKIALIGVLVAAALFTGNLLTISTVAVIGLLSVACILYGVGQVYCNTQEIGERFDELRQVLSEVKSVADNQVQTLEQVREGIETVGQDAKEIDSAANRLQKQNAVLQEQMEAAKKEAEQLRALLTTIEEALSMNMQISEKRVALQKMTGESLTEVKNTIGARIQASIGEINECKDRLTAKVAELAEAEKQAESLQGQIQTFGTKIDNLGLWGRLFGENLEKMQDLFEEQQTLLAQTRTKVATTKRESEELREKLERLRGGST